jgi:hypothetical protein
MIGNKKGDRTDRPFAGTLNLSNRGTRDYFFSSVAEVEVGAAGGET